jgi:hypothetical protein
MPVVLTPRLLNFLTQQGYNHLLSKTITSEIDGDVHVKIELTPIVNRPDIRFLPAGFDTYFDIDEEPIQMSEGIDDTEVVVRLSEEDKRNFEELLQSRLNRNLEYEGKKDTDSRR